MQTDIDAEIADNIENTRTRNKFIPLYLRDGKKGKTGKQQIRLLLMNKAILESRT